MKFLIILGAALFCLLTFGAWAAASNQTEAGRENATIFIGQDPVTGDDVIQVGPRQDMGNDRETRVWQGPIIVEPRIRDLDRKRK
ncbi:MAG: hypothetical protein EOM25_01820 [Deltaproteobacteria bacterium]|nr:hypothetical protein [Deltaproteobacteria bacterium]